MLKNVNNLVFVNLVVKLKQEETLFHLTFQVDGKKLWALENELKRVKALDFPLGLKQIEHCFNLRRRFAENVRVLDDQSANQFHIKAQSLYKVVLQDGYSCLLVLAFEAENESGLVPHDELDFLDLKAVIFAHLLFKTLQLICRTVEQSSGNVA